MKKYIIDGNNLIGKVKFLASIQRKDKQASKDKLAFMIDRFFAAKKVEVYLHYDGFEDEKINIQKFNIIYSENSSADEKIKRQIEAEKNKRNLIVISSDKSIASFAKVCGCEILLSENFGKELSKNFSSESENEKTDLANDIEEFKRLFNA